MKSDWCMRPSKWSDSHENISGWLDSGIVVIRRNCDIRNVDRNAGGDSSTLIRLLSERSTIILNPLTTAKVRKMLHLVYPQSYESARSASGCGHVWSSRSAQKHDLNPSDNRRHVSKGSCARLVSVVYST